MSTIANTSAAALGHVGPPAEELDVIGNIRLALSCAS